MVDSLRDQLLKCGFSKSAPAPVKHASSKAKGGRRNAPDKRAPASAGGEMDLAKAYALRAQTQARERHAQEQAAAEEARQRRERKARLQQLLDGKTLNKADADHPRSFEYAGKIRRVYVDADQLAALNAGHLGVVQQGGRYLLVTRDVAAQVREVDPHHLALLVDPDAPSPEADDGVPDDLIW